MTINFRVDPALLNRTDIDLALGDDIAVGDTLIYPCWLDKQVNGSNVAHLPRTVTSIIEYPDNRVFYFVDQCGRPADYGIVGRAATVGRARSYCTGCHTDHAAPECGYREYWPAEAR